MKKPRYKVFYQYDTIHTISFFRKIKTSNSSDFLINSYTHHNKVVYIILNNILQKNWNICWITLLNTTVMLTQTLYSYYYQNTLSFITSYYRYVNYSTLSAILQVLCKIPVLYKTVLYNTGLHNTDLCISSVYITAQYIQHCTLK